MTKLEHLKISKARITWKMHVLIQSNLTIDKTLNLQQAHKTCELALASMAGSDQNSWSSEQSRKDWILNEWHDSSYTMTTSSIILLIIY